MELVNQKDGGGFKDVLRRSKSYIVWPLAIVGSLVIAFGTIKFGVVFGGIAVAFLIGLPVLIYSMINLQFGSIVIILISFFLSKINRQVGNVPLGIVLDLFLLIMLIGLVTRKPKSKDSVKQKNYIGYAIWVWVIYNLFQFFNPAASQEGWLYVVRSIAILMLFFFVFREAIDSKAFLKTFIHVWIGLAVLAGLYGLFQEFHGLLPGEREWVLEDEVRKKLFYNWGRFRIFSFLNDPTIFGVLMSFTGLMCITLFMGPFSFLYRATMATCAGIMLLSMLYTGTRTAYVMFPAGFLVYALITFQTRTIAISAVIGLIGVFIIFSDIKSLGPIMGTNGLKRLRSAFRPSEDPSFQVREQSQSMIKPFIQSHPFGAGLATVSVLGRKFNPNSELGNFAPDSGYVRVAVELGWVGLIIYSALFGVTLLTGITNYYTLKDPELKAYMASLVAVAYCISVGNYPQQVVIQPPTSLLFYAMMAMIAKIKYLDTTSLK